MADSDLQDLRALCAANGPEQAQLLRRLLGSTHSSPHWLLAREGVRCGEEEVPELNRLRLLVQHGTLKAFVDGQYLQHGGGRVALTPEQQGDAARGSSCHTAPPQLLALSRRYKGPLVSVDAERDMLIVAQEEPSLRSRMVCVNPAHPTSPGGGYKQGRAGIEEDLHRRSGIFTCLGDPQKKFAAYRTYAYPLKSSSAVFSPNVAVVRGCEEAGFPFLLRPFGVHVVSTPLIQDAEQLGSPRRSFQVQVQTQLKTMFTTCAKYNATWVLFPMIPGLARHVKEVMREADIAQLFYRITFCRPAATTLRQDTPGHVAALVREYREVFGLDGGAGAGASAAPGLAQPGLFASRSKEGGDVRPAAAVGRKRPLQDAAGGQQGAKVQRVGAAIDLDSGGIGQGLSPADTVRLNIRKKLCAALGRDGDATRSERRAVEAEDALHRNFGGAVSADYRAQLRLLLSNLGDPQNGALREAVLCGDVPCSRLPTMDGAELCNPEKKAETASILKEITEDMQAASRPIQETSMYRCGRCRRSRCSYYEMQTRSGDEPMTQFITCLTCNHRWKI